MRMTVIKSEHLEGEEIIETGQYIIISQEYAEKIKDEAEFERFCQRIIKRDDENYMIIPEGDLRIVKSGSESKP